MRMHQRLLTNWRSLPFLLAILPVAFVIVGAYRMVEDRKEAPPEEPPPQEERMEDPDSDYPPVEGLAPFEQRVMDRFPDTRLAAAPEEETEPEPAPSLKVVGTVPFEGEALGDRIAFFFSQPLDVEAIETPFTAEPELEGDFRVGEHSIELRDFEYGSVAREGEGGHLLEVTLSEDVRSVDGAELDAEDRVHAFPAEALEARYMTELEATDDEVHLSLRFSLPVARDDLEEHLEVVDEAGEAVSVRFEAPEEGEDRDEAADADGAFSSWRVIIEDEQDWPVEMRVGDGLRDASGHVELAEARAFTYPSDRVLEVSRIDWASDAPDEAEVEIQFNAPVGADTVAEHLSIVDGDTGDPVDYEMVSEDAEELHTVRLDLPDPEAVYVTLELEGGMATALGRRAMPEPFEHSLHRRAEPFRIARDWWDTWRRREVGLNLAFNQPFTAPDIREHITIEPEVPEMSIEPQEDRRVAIYGEWASYQTYTITVEPGMAFGEDRTLQEPVTHTVRTDEIQPWIGFGQEGNYYFPRREGLTLPIQARNLDEATLKVHQLLPNNIALAHSQIQRGEGSYQLINNWSRQIDEQEIDLNHQPDRVVDTPLELDEIFPEDRRGVFTLEVEGEDYSGRATKVVLWTDIGMLSHWRGEELIVFAHDLESLAPLEEAEVTVYSDKNQELGQGQTGSDGILHLTDFEEDLGRPAMAVAEHGEDYTFLELQSRDEDILAFDNDMPAFDREGYDAYIYADRELYRPGETAHLRWLVRTNYGDTVGEMPLLATVTLPNGREIYNEPTELSELGSDELDFEIAPDAPTGGYTVDIRVPGDEESIGSYTFNVEDFVPNRITAEVTLDETPWMAEQTYPIRVKGEHLFGASAANRHADASVVLRRTAWTPEGWSGYRFTNDSDYTPETINLGEGRTDENGEVSFDFSYTPTARATFPMEASVTGRVFELGGRSVSGRATAHLFPDDIVPGVSLSPREEGGVEAQVAVVDPNGEPVDVDTVEVTLEREIWNYNVRRYYGRYEAEWSDRFRPVETKEVSLSDGEGFAEFPVSGYGYYRIRVDSDETQLHSTQNFYSYGGDTRLVEAEQPSLVKAEADQDQYEVGDTAEIRVEAPFDGQGIVVLQSDDIHDMIPVTIENGIGTASFEIEQRHVPNVWAVASVIHEIEAGRTQVHPFSSMDMVNLPVEDVERELDVQFTELPEEVEPDSSTEIEIAVDGPGGVPDNVELTLAAVDEGIHAITEYDSPDPLGWLFRTRRPEYNRGHYYDRVAYDFDEPIPGGDLDPGARIGEVDESWIKPVALWSGVVETDEDGLARIPLDIPEYTGQLRLDAVAASETALGAVTGQTYVRRPYMLQTSLPRFLSPDDESEVRATLFNHSEEAVTVALSYETSGALVEEQDTIELDVDAGGEASTPVQLTGSDSTGTGTVTWEMAVRDDDGDDLMRHEKAEDIPVRTPAVYQSDYNLVALDPGEEQAFTLEDFEDNELAGIELTVSADPMLRLADALERVVDYPWGGLQSHVSRLLPMLLLRDHEDLVNRAREDDHPPIDTYIQSGIDRLMYMQNWDGGLGRWAGSNQSHEYLSVYALHFLTLAKQTEAFDIPPYSFDALQEYARRIAYQYGGTSPERLHLRAYTLYVLALDGETEAVRQVSAFDGEAVPRSARYLLAAIIAQATGETDRAREYLTVQPRTEDEVRRQSGVLTSGVRENAIELMCLLQIDGDSQEIADRANRLITSLENRLDCSTHDSAFAIAALSEYLRDLRDRDVEASAELEGPDETQEVTGFDVLEDEHEGGHVTYTARNTGEQPVYVYAVTRGIPHAEALEPVHEGVEVTRRFRDEEGNRITPDEFEQMQSYVVELRITCDDPVENLAVSDLLPGGFEIENPRLDPDLLQAEPFDQAVEPDRIEMRDDRVVTVFERLGSNEPHHFYYVVRAVTPGTYQQAAPQAEALFEPRIRSRGLPETAVIRAMDQ
ncbi:MAG: alpha-2-macroglobulin family protein [Candidatus Hydrogenedentota bacterium]